MSRAEDRNTVFCPVEGCSNDRDPVLGLCRCCRALVKKEKIKAIAEAHGRIGQASFVSERAKAILAWNDAIKRAALDAEAWRSRYAAR